MKTENNVEILTNATKAERAEYIEIVQRSFLARLDRAEVVNPESREKIKAEATRAANTDFDSYLHKLDGKIGAEIAKAALRGRLWDGSRLHVVLRDGSQQLWDTKCILNQSVYGKLFNQWPTRQVKVGIKL